MQQTNTQHTEKFLRQRKMLLILPVLMIPMLALAFYGLGGGKGDGKLNGHRFSGKGLNMSLPSAQFNPKEKAANKLGLYKKADLDAAKLREKMKQDPYYSKPMMAPDSTFVPLMPLAGLGAGKPAWGTHPGSFAPMAADSQASKVLQKLEQLKQVMNLSGNQTLPTPTLPISNPERVVQRVKSTETVPVDPELDKLSAMLDKIYRIQHPGEAAPEDTALPGIRTNALAVIPAGKDPAMKTLVNDDSGSEGKDTDDADGFMEIGNSSVEAAIKENLIGAVIDQDQTLIAGATIGLRLMQDAAIAGVTIPRNSLLYGKVSVSGERFLVAVNSIRYQHTALPVSLEVYDQDGLQGIRIPGTISRDVSKESADEAMSGLGIASMDPTLGGQAANVGLQAAKTLISRKVKLVRGAVTAGYQVFLKNSKNKN